MLGLSRPEPSSPEGQVALPFDRGWVAARLPEVEALLPGLAGQPLSRGWSAAIDHTPDALPIVDEVRESVSLKPPPA